jgi:hypothetical protein
MAEGKGAIGFPPDFQYVGLEEWKGLNTKARRAAIEDQQCYWLENIIPIGAANARAMYGKGTTLYTAPVGRTVVYYAFATISTTDYCMVFLDNGTAYQIRVSDGASTTISSTGSTFYNGGDLPHITSWGTKGILIVSTVAANGYWGWDGTTLTAAGSVAPEWISGLSGGTFTKVGTATSGSTTLTAFADTINVAVGMLVTGTGIPSNTFVTGGTATTVTISNAATVTSAGVTFTFGWQMPTGINGVSIDTYQNRVFIVSGTKRFMSGASNAANFSASNDGNIATSYDSNLTKNYTHVLSAAGYVYLFADSSTWNISSIQSTTNSTAGTTTSTYQYSNTDPQTGTSYTNSVQVLGRAICFVNTNGVYALLGNTAVKISNELDGIWANLDTSVKPTSAVATIYGIRCLVVNIRARYYTGATRNFMCCWEPNGRKWWIASQEIAPTFIATSEIASNLTAYGSNGSIIYPMFQTASEGINKVVQSKLYSGGQASAYIIYKQILRFYLQVDALGANADSFTVTADTESSSVSVPGPFNTNFTFVNNSGGVLQFRNNTPANLYWSVLGTITAVDAQNTGELIGFTITSTGKDFIIERAGLGYRNETAAY